MFEQIAGWVAPAATMIAALMTAANLGPRVTGAGFVVFTAGSVAWCLVAVATDQSNLLWTNGFLVLVNLVGVWRWLGRQARFDQGGRIAAETSRHAATATVLPATRLIGAAVTGVGGASLGRVVDALMRCDGLAVSYFVISDGGLGGVGETLYAIDGREVRVVGDALETALTAEDLARRTALATDEWPAQLSSAHRGVA